MQDRLKKGRERLDTALETLASALRAGGTAQGRAGIHPLLLRQHRDSAGSGGTRAAAAALYKATVAFVRAYANIADEMEQAGYSDARHRAHQAADSTIT